MTIAVEPRVELPTFDLHRVEEALKVNHILFEGVALSDAEIADGIGQYGAFLARHKAAGMPEPFEVPNFLVDRVWHTHMCETRQYREDCIAYFGRIFEHASTMCNGGADD